MPTPVAVNSHLSCKIIQMILDSDMINHNRALTVLFPSTQLSSDYDPYTLGLGSKQPNKCARQGSIRPWLGK